MAYPVRIDPENPSRPGALEPIGGWLNRTRRNEVIAFSPLVVVFIEGGNGHPGAQDDGSARFVGTGVTVREAKKISKETVEIRTKTRLAHALAQLTPYV